MLLHRLRVVFGILVGFAVLIAGALFKIQILEHEKWTDAAEKLRWAGTVLPARRGDIFATDKSGEPSPLTASANLDLVFIDPKLALEDGEAEAAIDVLGTVLGDFLVRKWRGEFPAVESGAVVLTDEARAIPLVGPPEDFEKNPAGPGLSPVDRVRFFLRDKILENPDRQYLPIVRRLPPGLGDALRDRLARAEIGSVRLVPEPWRFYPENNLAGSIVGFLDHEGTGQHGIEGYLDDAIRGTDGRLLTERDVQGRELSVAERLISTASDGADFYLSIDRVIQKKAEEIISARVDAVDADGGQILVMETRTGRILAAAESPRFDPNRYGEAYARTEIWRSKNPATRFAEIRDLQKKLLDENRRWPLFARTEDGKIYPVAGDFDPEEFETGVPAAERARRAAAAGAGLELDLTDENPRPAAATGPAAISILAEPEPAGPPAPGTGAAVVFGPPAPPKPAPEPAATPAEPATATGRIVALERFQNRLGPIAYRAGAWEEIFEPGSIFKPLVMAAALDAGEVTPETRCDATCDGPVKIGDFKITTWNGTYHPRQTMTNTLEESDNTGMVFVTELLGKKLLWRYLVDFGFGKATGIGLPQEVAGYLKPWRYLAETERATLGFGQGITVTPLQVLTAINALANDGLLVRPILFDKIVRDGKTEIAEPTVIRRVIGEKAAADIAAMMVSVVENGGGSRAKVAGVRVAGKTGTAQIARAGGWEEGPGSTIASFIGFAPAEDPRVTILVKIDRPRATQFGSAASAPAFSELASWLFHEYWAG